MAITLHLCVLLLSFVTVRSGILTGKAFFCRDPDTGKLHSVNSTWQSTTFCGNYTCKLIQKNNQITKIEPFKKVNITNVIVSNENIIDNTDINKTKTVTIERKSTFHIPSILHKEINSDVEPTTDNKDRYLTESEIKAISEILHTVKKSDLDAIVDVYKLAQDIYKEMDTETTEKPMHETNNEGQDEAKIKPTPDTDHKHISYWYEPLHNTNSKGKAADMETAGTNAVNTAENNNINPNSYFRGTIAGTDFRKVPYYYPMSAFQRVASYAHNDQSNKVQNTKAPCSTTTEANQINVIKEPGYYLVNKPYERQSHRIIHPSILLPYPFSNIHHYNISSYPYNINYPWIQTGFNRRYYPAKLQTPIHNTVPQSILEADDLESSLLQDSTLEELVKRKIDKMPEWQTEQLAAQVLDEVKANMQVKSMIKAFPFRKKVKLEKVGKVIKLDELRRSRRAADGSSDENQDSKEAELFEVFLERTLCQSDTQPGFFRVGNQSHPYPECCPQRIKPTS